MQSSPGRNGLVVFMNRKESRDTKVERTTKLGVCVQRVRRELGRLWLWSGS